MKKIEKHKKNIRNNVTGILLLDKPVGISSNKSLQRIKNIYNAKKAGHTGNLDVPASGFTYMLWRSNENMWLSFKFKQKILCQM